MRVAVALCLAGTLATASSSHGSVETEAQPVSPIPKECRQLLVVRSRSWRTPTATLERYERGDNPSWKLVAEATPVNIGRNGMGWGRGLHPDGQTGPVKREGDGRAPAGVFPLALAFGAAEELPAEAKGFPYLHTLPTTYC